MGSETLPALPAMGCGASREVPVNVGLDGAARSRDRDRRRSHDRVISDRESWHGTAPSSQYSPSSISFPVLEADSVYQNIYLSALPSVLDKGKSVEKELGLIVATYTQRGYVDRGRGEVGKMDPVEAYELQISQTIAAGLAKLREKAGDMGANAVLGVTISIRSSEYFKDAVTVAVHGTGARLA